jgi:hypothetical protein
MNGTCIYGCAEPARLYPCGLRCDAHSPWVLAGRPNPEKQVDPATTLDALRTAMTLRDRGVAQVDANTDAGWKALVDHIITELARTRAPFTADDVRDRGVPDPPTPQAWGARFLAASKAGQIRRIGYQPSRRASVHAHPVAVWEGAA